MRISDWSSDVCSSDLLAWADAKAIADHDEVEQNLLLAAIRADPPGSLRGEVEQCPDRARRPFAGAEFKHLAEQHEDGDDGGRFEINRDRSICRSESVREDIGCERRDDAIDPGDAGSHRSEEHTSELQSLMRITYAVFCPQKKK